MTKAILLLAAAVALGGCTRQQARTEAGPASGGRNAQVVATSAVAATSQGAPAAYVDVRTPAEFAAGHVSGAINIPYDQMPQRWAEIDSLRARPVILYCRSGHRAGIALEELKKHGFASAVNGGGLEGLKAQGVPVTQ